MTKLFVNGCSITLGAELGETTKPLPNGDTMQVVDFEHRTKHRWSTLLKDILNMGEVVNLSRGGGSNWRTWRTTLDYFDTITENPDLAIIQLSGSERFQIPINEKYFRAHYGMDDWENWVRGGMYCPENDAYPIEEYAHWTNAEVEILQTKMGSAAKKSDVKAHNKFNSTIFQSLDNMRLIETMIYFFRAKGIPLYVWDGLDLIYTIESTLKCLELVERGQGNTPVDQLVFMLSDAEWFFDYKGKENYLSFLTKAKVYDKLYNKWQKLKSMPELSQIRYADMFMDKKHPDFVGKMPGYHPDERCHFEIANTIYFDMRGRGIWNP
jgi:hypothetical protein